MTGTEQHSNPEMCLWMDSLRLAVPVSDWDSERARDSEFNGASGFRMYGASTPTRSVQRPPATPPTRTQSKNLTIELVVEGTELKVSVNGTAQAGVRHLPPACYMFAYAVTPCTITVTELLRRR